MEQTWRWFGPDDVVQLSHIRQAGATGIVTALHQIPYGVVWSVEEIEKRKALIAADPSLGLRWSVVESLPIQSHQDRRRRPRAPVRQLPPVHAQPRALRRHHVCYNFMPVLDWTRTELAHPLPGGGRGAALQRPRVRGLRLLHAGASGRGGDHAARGPGARPGWFDARPKATGASCSPTSWPACPAPTTATTFRACARCSSATAA